MPEHPQPDRWPFKRITMVVCPVCGNKRCPKATDAALDCTGSNEPGQPGSSYRRVTLSPAVERLVRAAAETPRCSTCVHWVPDRDWQYERWGDCVLLSDAERDDTAGVHFGPHNEETVVGFTCPESFGCTLHQPAPDPEDPQP
jgi:hypothetical protein